MKAFFDRTEPYYLCREPTFDGHEVEVDNRIMNVLESRKATLQQMEDIIDEVALDDRAQEVTDTFAALLGGELTYETKNQPEASARFESEGATVRPSVLPEDVQQVEEGRGEDTAGAQGDANIVPDTSLRDLHGAESEDI